MGQRVSVNVASRPVTASRLVTVAKDSRIGKKPITVPKGVTVTIADKVVSVKVRTVFSEQEFIENEFLPTSCMICMYVMNALKCMMCDAMLRKKVKNDILPIISEKALLGLSNRSYIF